MSSIRYRNDSSGTAGELPSFTDFGVAFGVDDTWWGWGTSTPAQWCRVHVHGAEIVPGADYRALERSRGETLKLRSYAVVALGFERLLVVRPTASA